MLFPRKEEVLELHRRILEDTGGLAGVRDEGILDSALVAAANLSVCAATYAYHLTKNHPFADGNKRIGAAVAEAFLNMNGASLLATNDEIVEMFLGIADGSVSREAVEEAFGQWVRLQN